MEADETYIGREPGVPVNRGADHKMKVISLVDRTTGRARSMVVDNVNAKVVAEIVTANVAAESRLMTDQATVYRRVGKTMAGHQWVNHSVGEYVSTFDRTIHTNTIEGFFSIFKRGMKGVYQHASKKHLHRYLAEFDFRYSNRAALGVDDTARAVTALQGVVGKRLTYRSAGERA